MSLLVLNDDVLLIGVKRSIIIYNLKTKNDEFFTLPEEVIIEEKNTNQNAEIQEKEQEPVPNEIQDLYTSKNGELLAVTTNVKELFLFDVIDNKFIIKFQKKVVRKPSTICFSPDLKVMICSDKTGDCYLHDINNNINLSGKWILGHLSMLLDSLFTPDGKYIITCDRDEKIRVTCYPETHIIESYCLGHTEYISSINLLPHENNVLISISGDEKIKFWKYLNGTELNEINLSAPGYKLASAKINDNSSFIAIILCSLECVVIYEVKGQSENLETKLIKNYKINNKIILSMIFDKNNNLILSEFSSTGILNIVTLLSNDLFTQKIDENQLNNLLLNCGELNTNHLNEVSLMFKKKFDNIKDYHERKRKRMEEKYS